MTKRNLFFLFMIIFLFPLFVTAQNNYVRSQFTTAAFQKKFYDGLIKWSINNNLAASLDDSDGQYEFRNAFWPMELIQYKSDYAKERLAYAFTKINKCNTYFQRGLLEVVYTNWPEEFSPQVKQLMKTTNDPKIFAMCAEYLWHKDKYPLVKKEILNLLVQKFDTVQHNVILMTLRKRIGKNANESLPPLKDIYSEQFAPGLTVMYSFQRHDRNYPGMVIVRKPDGSFVKDSSGHLFSVPQLALSVSNLPFYLTNGNTPQGIYRMSGFDVSTSRFIGPTENIQLSMPFEIPLDSFIISYFPAKDTSWTIDKYRSLLPPSWQQYEAIYQSFYAGEAGRTEIIAHGTTINPAYYKGKIYYPQTPSLGCLCTYESWSPETGIRMKSDQQKLVDAIKKAGDGIGYAIVIELDDQKKPVSLEDITPYIPKKERK